MTVLSAVLNRIRGKKTAQKLTLWQQYREQILEPLANGEEIDSEEIEQFLESLGYDENRLEQDVAKLQKRIVWSKQLRSLEHIQDSVMPSIEREIEEIKAEIERVTKPLQDKIAAASLRYTQVTAQIGQVSALQSELSQTCLDPELLEKEKSIKTKMSDLGKERAEIEQRSAHEFSVFDYSERQIASLQAAQSNDAVESPVGTKKTFHQKEAEKTIAEHQRQADRLRPTVTAARKRLAEIQREHSLLNDELKKIMRLKFQP